MLIDLPHIVHLTNDDCLISFLPLAHMFERVMVIIPQTNAICDTLMKLILWCTIINRNVVNMVKVLE
jgi:long-subunit acyl-CoA synthetase (AMP-forming)